MLLQLSWSQGKASCHRAPCNMRVSRWSPGDAPAHPRHWEQAEGTEQPSLCQQRSSIGTGTVFPSHGEVPERCLYLDSGIF